MTDNEKQMITSLEQCIKDDIEKYDKKVKKCKSRTDILIIASILAMFLNLYRFITMTDSFRYINLFLSFVMIYVICSLWNSYRKLYNSYQKIKENEKIILESLMTNRN